MSEGYAEASLGCVQNVIASGALGPPHTSRQLGSVTLLPHQCTAAARLSRLASLHGGAMLADEVGMGKTFTALAAARGARDLVVIAPATLRGSWQEALQRASLRGEVLSFNALSRRGAEDYTPDWVIVDEAHHLRSTNTLRYAAAARLCRGAHVLLLSATPIHNRVDDLAAQLALFLGARAHRMSDSEVALHIVRRHHDSATTTLPRVNGPHWLRLPAVDDWLEDILALPSPVPPSDGGDAGALLAYTLVQQWASSRAALLRSLRRRRAQALALADALEAGRHPSRQELSAWCFADDSMQLAFPELVTRTPIGDPELPSQLLLAAVRTHERAVHTLIERMLDAPDPDSLRAECIRCVRRQHVGERVIVFSQFAATVRSLAQALRWDAGVAWITGSEARVASGTVTRDEILGQFSPGRARSIAASEKVHVLLTTDVLSEGLDLHDASVLIHMDLPWNPARLEQRVGRLRRLGSPHGVITVYALAPPAAAERLVEVEQRLRRKLAMAGRSVGTGDLVLPPENAVPGFGAVHAPSAVELEERIVNTLEQWLAVSLDSCKSQRPVIDTRNSPPVVAAAIADFSGWIALVSTGHRTALVADIGADAASDVLSLSCAISAACGRPMPLDAAVVATALDDVHRWLEHRRGALAIGAGCTAGSPLRRRALARLARITLNTQRHSRGPLAEMAGVVRSILSSPLSVGSERMLARGLESIDADAAWLESVIRIGNESVRYDSRAATPTHAGIVALIVLRPPAQASAATEA